MKKIFYIALFFCAYISLIARPLNNVDTLKVAYRPAPPFIIQNEGTLEGINIWLWKKIAKNLELQYEFTPMNFSEMLGALKGNTIDICINPLTITSQRSKQMDFTHSYYASNSTIVVYETSSLQKISMFLQSVFNLNFLRAFFVLIFLISLFGIIIWLSEKRANPEEFRPSWRGVWDGLWWSVVTMTTVGYGDKSPKSRAGKIVALIWMFSGLLFISGLTASVASMLTINQLQSNPNGFNEFKESPVGCIENSSTHEFLRERFFNKIHLYESITKGLEDLNKNKIKAFLYDEPILRYSLNQDIKFQHLELLPTKFDLQFYAFGLPKHRDDLKDAISQEILEIIESLEWRIILNEYNLSEI